MDTEPRWNLISGAWGSAMALGLVAILGTTILVVVESLTRERITQQQEMAAMNQLVQVIDPDLFDNKLHEDRITVTAPKWFFDDQTVIIYRARKQSSPVAVVFRFATPNGYNGNIHLLIGIKTNGTISGVRVISHNETPGLGDAIETRKSGWILGFSGFSLNNLSDRDWAVRKDGGQFDQFTGATITPRAIVQAVRNTLEYFEIHREQIMLPGDEPNRNVN